jgi:Flp pilus assembly protein TadG
MEITVNEIIVNGDTHNPMQTRRSGQRGFTLVIHALMLTATVGAIGLAVDVGTFYMIKARMSAAVDGAALAAGRSVNLADDLATAQSDAIATAHQFFTANFPSNYLNTLGSPTVTPSLNEETDDDGNPLGVLDITVTASATAPTYFMNVFGVHSTVVATSSTASRRGLVMLLVLDQSSSMNTSADPVSGLTACQAMKQAAQNFITLFSPYDHVGMITFDITAHLAYPPSTNFRDGSLNTAIGNIVCGSNTNTISALELAYQQIKNQGLKLALNTIVLFTDGSPNGISADFPVRTALDSRWGPALASPAPPGQSGATFTHNNSCSDVGPGDPNGTNEEAICINMPVVCATAGTVRGTLAQWGGQDSWGASTYGLAQPMDSDPTPSFSSKCSSSGIGTNARQFIAYIPDNDIYGNSLHGVPSTGLGPTVSGGMVTRDFWLFQTTNLCSPNAQVSPNCKNTGDLWSSHTTVGSGSNFFPATNTYINASTYGGFFRPDQPNSVVAASMNGTMAEANRIRADVNYHPVINTIYLTGNGTDSVDREFLAIVANFPTIPPLPYDPANYVPYTNPAFQDGQQVGQYFATADRNELQSLFAQLASEILRLSH